MEEAQKLLTLGSLGMVDAEDNSKIQYLIRTGQLSQEQIQNAQSYIKGHVVQEQATFPDEHRHYGSDLVPESSKTQTMFTVSQEQYYNHDYNPNTDMGGLGVSPALELLPIGKGFNLGKAGVKGVNGKIKPDIPHIGSKHPDPNINKNIEETVGYIINDGKPPKKIKQNWGRKFENKYDDLPLKDTNGNPIEYKEYRVRSSKEDNVHRIVVGTDGRYYYTNTHYGTSETHIGIPFYEAGKLPKDTVEKIFKKDDK